MLEMFQISTVIAVTFVVVVWVVGIVARALVRYGAHLGRTAAARKREQDMAALNIPATDGGVLGDLSRVLVAEDLETKRTTRGNRWRLWRRIAMWRAARGVAFWKAQRDEACETANEMRDELARAYCECNQLRRENAFLRGDVTADPKNGKLWPAINGSRSRR